MSKIQKNDTILFQGDSITDAGRRDAPDGLGGGYVAMVRGMLQVRRADMNLTVLNRGIGGDRTVELLDRWKADCEDLHPQVLSIKIGVNDVWRLRGEWNSQKFVPMTEYRDNYRKLLDRAKAAGVRQLVLMSPTTIANDEDVELASHLDERAAFVKEIAGEYDAIYVPTRETQKAALKDASNVRWTGDGCHPTPAGHALLATTWMQAVGLL